jgi:hypothetical protein
MFRLIASALLFSALAGCASTQPPSCDGTKRRPVNVPPQTGVTYLSCGAAA